MYMRDYEDYYWKTRYGANGYIITNTTKPKKVSDLEIKNVIFNPPATIVFWADGTKTVVKCCEEDVFSEECGLAMAICKKVYGNDNTFHKIFKKYIKEPEEVEVPTLMPISDEISEMISDKLRHFKEGFGLK